MTASQSVWRIGFVICGVLIAAPCANAEPNPPPPPRPPAVGDIGPSGESVMPPDGAAGADGGITPANAACAQFSDALSIAATTYNGFADVTSGDKWNYSDPAVSNANVVGRTALREAASISLSASSTPGLQPEIASQMRGWSAQAAKLLLIMGLRGSKNATDNAAEKLNQDTYNTQMACANFTAPGLY